MNLIWQSIQQHDNSWFEIKTRSNVNVNDKVLAQDVVSFTVTEQINKIDKASLQLLDRHLLYANILQPFNTFMIKWGRNIQRYANMPSRSLGMYISDFSGSGDDNGKAVYNCNFTASDAITDWKSIAYENKTRKAIIEEVFTTQFKMLPSNFKVDFVDMNKQFSDGQQVVQAGNAFRFMIDRAADWQAMFRLCYDGKGMLHGIFVDGSKWESAQSHLSDIKEYYYIYGNMSLQDRMKDAEAQTPLMPKGKNLCNVISYEYKNEAMNAARGDGIRLEFLNGVEVEAVRYVVSDDKVGVWRLVPEKITDQWKAMDGDVARQSKFIADMMTINSNWTWAKQFYIYDTTTTAPQGHGYRISMKLLGDPTITAGCICKFGYGFPNCIGAENKKWWVEKCTHSISSKGYFTDVDVIDNFVVDPTGNTTPLIPRF